MPAPLTPAALPENLRVLAESSRASEIRSSTRWGAVLTLGAGGLSSYLIYYVLRRTISRGEFLLRNEEALTLVVSLGFLAVGLGLLAAAYQAKTGPDQSIARLTSSAILSCRRVVNSSGRYLAMRLGDGTELRWRFPGVVPNEAFEIAAVEAVMRLPGWQGEGAARSPASGQPAQPTAQERQARALAAVQASIDSQPGPEEGKRTAVEAPFAQVAHAMETAGLRLSSHMEPGVQLGPKPIDPIRADYLANGARAVYWRNGDTGLQTVQVVGERAAQVYDDILNVGYLPVLHGKLPDMLASSDRREVLRALAAIAFVHAGKPGRFYGADLARLVRSEDPEVRAAAQRAGAARQ